MNTFSTMVTLCFLILDEADGDAPPAAGEIEDEEVQQMMRDILEDEDICRAEEDILPYMDRLHTSQLAPTPPPMETANQSTHERGK